VSALGKAFELNYEPREAFIPFHQRDRQFAVLVCHRRAGKTVACVAELILRALYSQRPRAKFAYIGPYRQQAKETAQRREKDPAAKRVRLVKDMGYLSLKRAALLGLLQQQQMGEQQQQQEGQQQEQQEEQLAAEVRKLNLAEVTAQLLDARWSTQQLEVTAQAAAQQIKEQRQQAKSAKLAPQQPRPQQQPQQQLPQQALSKSLALSTRF
jgi:hypothetical protein